MWVFCCGMPRSGSTLQYQLTKEIVETKNVGLGLGWVEPEKFSELYDKNEYYNIIKVVKSHRYIPKAKELVYYKKAKAIHVYRDLRDIIVSIMNKEKISFWKFITSNNIDAILHEAAKWSNVNNILISKYEDMVGNLLEETKKIAKFLNIYIEDSSATKIANKFSIENQRKRIQKFDYTSDRKKSGKDIYDAVNLLHPNHIFSGRICQWEESLSDFEAALIEDIGYRWLRERNYQISQSVITRKMAKVLYIFLLIASKLSSKFGKIVEI